MKEDEEAIARIGSNKIQDLSTWDFDKLDDTVRSLEEMGWNMSNFAFGDMDLFMDEPAAENPLDEDDGEIIETGPNGEPASETYKVMVFCKSPQEQGELMDRLLDEGFNCQAL